MTSRSNATDSALNQSFASDALTMQTLIPGGNEANRVTAMYYDWRGRAVATLAGYGAGGDLNRPLTVQTYNNLDWVTETRVYDGDSITIDSTASDGVPAVPGEDEVFLRARTTQEYDDRGRAFRSSVFNIDQQVGTSGSSNSESLATNFWYDDRDLVIRTVSPGGLFTKTKYDGAGRPTDVYLTDGGSDTECGNPNDITDDTVIEHTHADFDKLGNVLMTTLEQRQPDGTMRTSYTQNWYDTGGRSLGTADLGTAGGNYSTPAAARAAGALVTSYTYDAAGNVQTVTDPKGIVTDTDHDSLERATVVTENASASSVYDKRTTAYGYTALDQPSYVQTTNMVPGATAGTYTPQIQRTEYRYLSRTDGGDDQPDPAGVHRYDAAGHILTTLAEGPTTFYTYDLDGNLQQTLLPNGVTEDYDYDVFNRLVLETVTRDDPATTAAVETIPVAIGRSRRWLLSAIEDYLARKVGRSASQPRQAASNAIT